VTKFPNHLVISASCLSPPIHTIAYLYLVNTCTA